MTTPVQPPQTKRKRRYITIKLTQAESDALLNAGNRGIEDLHDVQDDESSDAAELAEVVLRKIGAAYSITWEKHS